MRHTVTLYTRQGCCLCEQAREVLRSARRRADFDFEVVDIDADTELHRLYTDLVPVVAIDGVKAFQYSLTETELLKKLEPKA